MLEEQEEFNPNQLVEEVKLPFWLTVAVASNRPELLALAPTDVDPNVANFIRVLMLTNQKLREKYLESIEQHKEKNHRFECLINKIQGAVSTAKIDIKNGR